MEEYAFNSFYMQHQNILFFIKELSEGAFLLITYEIYSIWVHTFLHSGICRLVDNVPYYYGIVYVQTVKDIMFLTT